MKLFCLPLPAFLCLDASISPLLILSLHGYFSSPYPFSCSLNFSLTLLNVRNAWLGVHVLHFLCPILQQVSPPPFWGGGGNVETSQKCFKTVPHFSPPPLPNFSMAGICSMNCIRLEICRSLAGGIEKSQKRKWRNEDKFDSLRRLDRQCVSLQVTIRFP